MSIGLVSRLTTNTLRALLAGNSTKFCFYRSRITHLPEIKETSLYIHIPFCNQLCPYCPYNRIRYNPYLASKYIDSLLEEIKYYALLFPNLKVTSIYFGGGTPTVLGQELEKVVSVLEDKYSISGPLCIETNPFDLSREKVHLLKSLGFNMVSLGVESFSQELLNRIGRKYSVREVYNTLSWLEAADFRLVNLDLMFALPGEKVKELQVDIKKAAETFVNQITAYPLFIFPYSSVGRFLKLRNIRLPRLSLRRTMYYYIYDYLTGAGYRRVSVWSFKKTEPPGRFSSVTRERFIGFGPGAGSYYESVFTLNTFSVNDYIASVKERGHAKALEMPFTTRLSILYDFYWRLYDTYIPKRRELDNFSYTLGDISLLSFLLTLGKQLGFIVDRGENLELTREGSFWVHLMQNYFVLPYINKIWTEAKSEPWSKFIPF